MHLQLNLDDKTRSCMLVEVDSDVSCDNLYISPRLSRVGQHDYQGLLREAIESHDDVWLANKLRENGRLNPTEERRKRSGGISVVKVPVNAPNTLAEGEFNRFYARGLCLRAMEEGIQVVVVYRTKNVENPRVESERMIDRTIDATALLKDLRKNVGVEPALGLPPGPNSGLSIRLP